MTRSLAQSTFSALVLLGTVHCGGSSDSQLTSGSSETSGWGEEGDGGGSGETGAGDEGSGTATTSTSGGFTGTGDGDGTTTGGFVGDGDGEPPPPTTTGDGDGDGDGDGACDLTEDVTLFLSSDDSNSMSSPVLMRALGGYFDGLFLPRPWEWMNYYSFDYAPAAAGTLRLDAALEDEPTPGQYRLQVAVTSEFMSADSRPPMNVTLVLDTSGSMGGEPIDLLRETSRVIAGSLRAGDTVSMVEWDTGQTFTLDGHAVSGPNDPTLVDAINDVTATGGTDLNGGLTTGYSLAQANFDPMAVNRLVLISDGGANAGLTDVELIASNAAFGGSDGIYLVGVGVGNAGSYRDQLMDKVTDAGKGAAVFIDSPSEAAKIFGDQFENTMTVAAREVQVQLDMPPGFEIVKFSGEEFGENPEEIEPQHLAPNDSMVFHQVIESCDAESVTGQTEVVLTARWLDPWTFQANELSRTFTFDELRAGDVALLHKGQALDDVGKAFAEFARGDASLLQPAREAVEAALLSNPDDVDLLEVLDAVNDY